MRLPKHLLALAVAVALLSLATARAEEPAADEADPLADQTLVMVPLTDGEAPSQEEWNSLHDEPQRASLFGSLGDFKSPTISFMNTRYLTANRAEGTLAAYGKEDAKKGFDRYGHIAGVAFDVPANSWKQRYALNAAALVKLTGRARFHEFAGVELDAAAKDRRQIEVTFIGTMVPKDEAVRRLNADLEALEYLMAVQVRRMQHKPKFSLLGTPPPPPAPKIVLSNVLMLDGKSSKAFELGLGGAVETVIHGVGGELKLSKQGSEDVTLLSPVVRCYRTYTIEFKTDADGRLQTVNRQDAEGRVHQVPVVFDLTPDL